MLTRREILLQLKAAGIREKSLLKQHCRDFEIYMARRYGLKMGRGDTRVMMFAGKK